MPSFDAVLEPNLVELKNAVDQTGKEIGTRFDFKGSSAKVELTEKGASRELMLYGDSDFQIGQVRDVLLVKLTKRAVDIRFLDLSAKIEKIGGDNAKKIQTLIKQSKLKVQAQIQGDVVRVSGGKRDDLQVAIRHLKAGVTDLPLSFTNFRD
jgi:uncharacterized protein YajQ (UPF0234 family)